MDFPNFKKSRLSQLITQGLVISGRGGSSGGGGARTPVEANDTVNSRAMASVLDLLGEGVVGGLVDGAKSIFLNDTPLQNDDGSYNFSGVTWWFRDGSQDQSVIDGFDFIETPKSVAVQLKQTNQVNVALDSSDSDRVRVVMKFPSLRNINKENGDTNATTVQYKFQIDAGNGKGFVDVIAEGESTTNITLTAKKTGVYYRSYVINLPKPAKAYTLRAIRLTEDHNDNSYLYDDTYVDSIGEIVNTSLNYPNSVMAGLKINSEQFGSSMPTRSYLIKGMKIRVPSNYNVDTNVYDGNWDGTFKMVSSSNPAWILFDLLTNTRYGLGEFVKESMLNIGELYQIGRYCDAFVDDGFGGQEKRFAINTQITSRQDAYRVVQDIAGAFRGMVYWTGGMVHVTQDSPADPVMLFSNSNVVNGTFAYKGSARKDRYSIALITYNNKEDGYKQSVEYVEDQEAIKRYGIRKTESVAFGCTSRGQAHRVGLWTLYTSRMESDVITFSVGMDSVFLMPGDVVLIADKFRAGRRNSGRVTGFTANSIKLDAPVDLTSVGNHITFMSTEGKMIERDILENGSNVTTVTFKAALTADDTPVADAVWVIAQPDLAPLQARVASVSEGTDGTSFDITAIQNNPTKYEAIDSGAQLIPQNTTVLDPTYSKPSGLNVTEGTYLSSPGNLSVSLTAAWQGKSAQYYISWRRSDAGNVSNWKSQRVTEEQFEIRDVAEDGQYDFQVYAVSVGGLKTDTISTTYKVLGTMSAPGAPTALSAVGDYRSVVLNWANPSSVDLDHIEVLGSKTNDSNTAILIAKVTATTFTHNGLEDDVTWYYWVRASNKRGMLSQLNSSLGTSGTTKDVLSFLKNKITNSELGSELLADIDSKAVSSDVDAAIQQANVDVQNQLNQARTEINTSLDGAQQALSSAISKEVTDRSKAVADEAAARAKSVSDEETARNEAIASEAAARAQAVNDEADARAKAISNEAVSRSSAISDSIAIESDNRAKAIADTSTSLNAKIDKEASSRAAALVSLDTKTSTAISSEATNRVNAVELEARTRADSILQEKTDRQADVTHLTTKIQTSTDSLAQQISQVAAGTGEQFDSLKIWYFDSSSEGWSEDDAGSKLATVTSDGWLKTANASASYRSPNSLSVTSNAYRFFKLRIKKIGSPAWAGKLYWLGDADTAWSDSRSVALDEPDYDANGIATLTIHDVPWQSAPSVRRVRFDFLTNQTDKQFIQIDWIAVGRPTPGAGMAALQDEKTARANADAAEATHRSTLATQLRGSYDGNDLSNVSSGLIFQEQQERVTADKAEANARQTLETKLNDSVSNFSQSIDTLNTKDEALASDITSLKSSLGSKADASALQTLQTNVNQQGSSISTQGQSITKLQNDLNATTANVGKKADQTALVSLQGTVTQQGNDIASANSSITNLRSSLDTTNNNVGKKADATTVNDLTSRVTSSENKLSSQSDSLVKLNNSLTQMASMGTNPWLDGSFESYANNEEIGGASLTVTTDRKYSGAKSALARRLPNEIGNSDKQIGPLMAIRAGAKYRFELWAYMSVDQSPSVGWSTVIGINTLTREGRWGWGVAVNVNEASLGSRDTWVKLTGIVTIPDEAVTGRVWVSTRGAVGANTPGYAVYLDGMIVTEITDAVAAQSSADANASALSSMQNTVTQQGKDLVSQGTSVTDLKNSLNSTNNNVQKKADSSVVATLQSTVTQQGKDISSASSNIDVLKNTVNVVQGDLGKKADASALQSLQNSVTQQNNSLATQSASLTQLSNQLNNSSVGGVNLIKQSGTMDGWSYLTNQKYRGNAVIKMSGQAESDTYKDIETLTIDGPVDGSNYVYSFYAKSDKEGQKVFAFFYNPGTTLSAETSQGTKGNSGDGNVLLTLTKNWVRYWIKWTQTPGSGSKRLILARVQPLTTDYSVYISSPKFEVGNTPTDWSPAPSDSASANTVSALRTDVDATSNALQSVTSRVQKSEGDVTTQGASLTSLKNGLAITDANVAKKADSSALQTLQNTVKQQGSDISSQSTSIATLQNNLTVGANLIPNPTLANNGAGWSGSFSVQDGRNSVTQTTDYFPQPPAFAVTPGDLLDLSIDAKALATFPSLNIRVRFDGGAVSNLAINAGSVQTPVVGTWYTIKSTVTVPANVSKAQLQVSKGGAYPAAISNVIVTRVSESVVAQGKAISSLTNTVTQQGDAITSQGNSLTSLKNGLDSANETLGKKANADAFTSLQNTVASQGDALTTQGSNLTSLKNELSTAINKKADATALSNLQNTVTQQGSNLSSQGESITTLKNSLDTTNTNVSKKADASALSSLQSTVTQQGKDLTSQSNSLTSLKNSLDATNTTVGKKADVVALNSLQNTVTSQGDSIKAQTNSITSLQSALNTTNTNVGKKADALALSSLQGTVASQGDAINSQSDSITKLQNSLKATNDSAAANAGAIDTLTSKVNSQAGDISSVGKRTTTLENGLATTNANVGKKADASALSTLQNTVSQQGNALSTQSGNITSLQNSMSAANSSLAKKADSAALSALQSTVTSQAGDITSQGNSITSLQNGLTIAANMIPNPTLQNNGAGWSGDYGVIDGKSSTVSSYNYYPQPPSFGVAEYDRLDVSVDFKAIDAFSDILLRVRFDGDVISNVAVNVGTLSNLVQGTWYTVKGTITVPAGAKKGQIQFSRGGNFKIAISNAVVARVTDSTVANTNAITTLSSLVSKQGDDIASSSSAISSLQNSLKSANDNIGKKADSSALDTLSSRVASQGDALNSHGSRVTDLESSVTIGDNIVPNSAMLNNSQGWNGSATTVDGYPAVVSSSGWAPTSPKFSVTPGDIIDLSLMCLAATAMNGLSWGIRFDGPSLSNYTSYVGSSNYTAGEKKSVSGSITVPAGATTGCVQPSTSSKVSLTLYNVDLTRRNAGTVTNSKAISELSNTVTRQGKDIVSSSSEITSLQNGLKSANDSISKKADASALSSLQNTVTQQGKDIVSQGSSLTQLTNDLSSTNASIDAASNALTTLTSRVTNAEGSILSQSGSITALNNTLTALNKTVIAKAETSALQSLQNTVTQQGKDLSAASGSITNLRSSLDQALKQGANLVTDGSFENGSVSGNLSIVTSDRRSGNYSARFTRNSATNSGGNNDVNYGGWFDLRASQVVYVEVWLKLDAANTVVSPNGYASVGMQWQNSDQKNRWSSAVIVKFSDLTSTWQKFSGYVTTGADAFRGVFWMSIPQNASNIQGYSFLLDDVIILDATDGYNAQQSANAASSAVNDLSTRVETIDGKVTAQASQLSSMQSKVDGATSKVDQLSKTISDNQSTQASLNTSLQSQIGAQASANIKNQTILDTTVTSIASIKSTQSTQSTQLGAISKAQTDMSASMNSAISNQAASIQTLQQTVANNDALNSTWMVKMQTNSNGQQYAAGIALGVDGKNMQSQFLVQADRFALINTSNNNTTTPFVIDNGVTYMNSAYIKNGSIDSAKVGDLMSSGFQENVKGWRISRDGTMNINGSSGGTGRMVLSNNRLDVFDDNNVLRVRLGML